MSVNKKTRTKPYRVQEDDLITINMMLAKKGISFQAYVDELIQKDIKDFENTYKNGGYNKMDFEVIDNYLNMGDTILNTLEGEQNTPINKIKEKETLRLMDLLERMLDRQIVNIDGEDIHPNEYIEDNTLVNYLIDSLIYIYKSL